MHLLREIADGEYILSEFYGEEIPPYAILSHTWIATHEEVTFKEIAKKRGRAKAGYQKLQFIAKQAAKDGLKYFWVDTCCIDKASSAELQEAINSMFRWYRNSTKCYVYLADVSIENFLHQASESWTRAFRQSKWFTRGWTLQELLAPSSVEFFSVNCIKLGNKHSLRQDIYEVTGIDPRALQQEPWPLQRFPVRDRLSWADKRKTRREEDKAYSLLGLFNVTMYMLYGEGSSKAFDRLHEEIRRAISKERSQSKNVELFSQLPSPQINSDNENISLPKVIEPSQVKRKASEAFAEDSADEISPYQESTSEETRIAQGIASPMLEVAHLTNNEEQARTENMRQWWEEAMAKNTYQSREYSHVAVLLLKWADDLDELETRSEFDELEAIFRERFHFKVEVCELNVLTKPQLQLNQRVSAFIEMNDGPRNLLIVYYIGHGTFQELYNELQLAASVNPRKARPHNLKAAHAVWNKAEDILRSEDVDADVLTILDTCYASNVTKLEIPSIFKEQSADNSRKFELLSACSIDQTTAAPGPESFTRALIDNLSKLSYQYGDRPFSTFQLNQRICMEPRRADTPSHLWYRLRSEDHILLAPMTANKAQRQPRTLGPARGLLTLDFVLKDRSLTREQIEYLTRDLAKTFEKRKLGLRGIKWRGMRSSPSKLFERVALAMIALVRWKRAILAKRSLHEVHENK